MALQTSGAISLNDIHVEAGGSSGTTCSMNDTDIRGLTAAAGRTINSTPNGNTDFADYYGASAEVQLPTSGSTVNGQVQLKEISASSYISSGGTLRIPSSMWVWSDTEGTAALTIDIPCTVINDGKIIGCGGRGGSGLRIKGGSHPPTASAYNAGYSTGTLGSGNDGSAAINVTSSGVTIVNSSGAYIAGGGGGGGSSGVEPMNTFAGGGGGAGGGDGGSADLKLYTADYHGYGGTLNQKGSDPQYSNYTRGTETYTYGGEAGGAGFPSAGEDQRSPSGAGGGRILPGVRVNSYNYGSYGGAANEAGQNGGSGGYSGASGGGGGWGAAGGRGYRGAFTSAQCQGGSAGAAIAGTSRTLSNSGTIYGAT